MKKKLIIYAVVAILFIVVLFVIKKRIKALVQTARDKKKIAELENVIEDSELTYPSSYYTTFADQLQVAMEGAGTNEAIICDIFGKMRNINDCMQLNVAFGVREEETLSQWLESDGERQAVNKILQDLKINYSF